MNALDAGIRAEVASGGLTQDEYDLMSIPTWNRTLAEFTAPFDAGGALGLTLLESELDFAPDAYLAADRVFARVAEAAAADPEAMETLWHVAVLRIAKPA